MEDWVELNLYVYYTSVYAFKVKAILAKVVDLVNLACPDADHVMCDNYAATHSNQKVKLHLIITFVKCWMKQRLCLDHYKYYKYERKIGCFH